MPDKYQKKYLAHQARKAKVLREIMEDRHSDRVFGESIVDPDKITAMIETINLCPSSCDRKAIYSILVTDKDEKILLGGVLVGGVGFIHRAPNVLLLFADPIAYKAGDEIKFIPFEDAGVVVEALYLTATSLGLKCCFVNPNIRDMNKKHFKNIFGDGIFCGAFIFGNPKEEIS
jgi:nitroreductase